MLDLESLNQLEVQLRESEERKKSTMRATQKTFGVVAMAREMIDGSRELLNKPIRS